MMFSSPGSVRERLFRAAVDRGCLDRADLRRIAKTSQGAAERILNEMVADGWLIEDGFTLTINHGRPGMGAYLDWYYIEHGLREPPAPTDTSTWRETLDPRHDWREEVEQHHPGLLDRAAVMDHSLTLALTPAGLRAAFLNLCEATPPWRLWDEVHQTLYSRHYNEQDRDLIHAFINAPDIVRAAKPLDVRGNDFSAAELSQRWIAAVILLHTEISRLHAYATILMQLADTGADLRDLQRTIHTCGTGVGLLSPGDDLFHTRTSTELRRRAMMRTARSWQGFASPDEFGTAGDGVHAMMLIDSVKTLTKIITAEPTPAMLQSLGLQLTWKTDLPEKPAHAGHLPHPGRRGDYAPPPADAVQAAVDATDLIAGDYIVDPDSERLTVPLLVLSAPDPDDPTGQFLVRGPSDDYPWYAYAAALDGPIAILRPTPALAPS